MRTCQYISDEPSADDACKCGLPIAFDQRGNYCDAHRVLVTAPDQTFSDAIVWQQLASIGRRGAGRIAGRA
jgi:hypothetical protein